MPSSSVKAHCVHVVHRIDTHSGKHSHTLNKNKTLERLFNTIYVYEAPSRGDEMDAERSPGLVLEKACGCWLWSLLKWHSWPGEVQHQELVDVPAHFFLPDALAYPYDICYPNYIYFPGIDRHTPELGCPLANHTGLCSCVLISRKGLFGIRELKSPFRVWQAQPSISQVKIRGFSEAGWEGTRRN